MERENQLIIVRGGGDIATGTIHKLHRCGYPVLVLETAAPSAIRRQVALSEAVYDGVSEVEGAECVRVSSWKEAKEILSRGQIPLRVDPRSDCRLREGAGYPLPGHGDFPLRKANRRQSAKG